MMTKAMVAAIICRDKWTKSAPARVVNAKRSSIEASRGLVQFIDSSGCNGVMVASDNEDAIGALMDDIVNRRVWSTPPMNPLPRHPQTHGVVEKGVQDVADQLRKLKFALEQRTKAKMIC